MDIGLGIRTRRLACDLLETTEANQRVLLHRARTRVRAALEVYLDAEAGGDDSMIGDPVDCEVLVGLVTDWLEGDVGSGCQARSSCSARSRDTRGQVPAEIVRRPLRVRCTARMTMIG